MWVYNLSNSHYVTLYGFHEAKLGKPGFPNTKSHSGSNLLSSQFLWIFVKDRTYTVTLLCEIMYESFTKS